MDTNCVGTGCVCDVTTKCNKLMRLQPCKRTAVHRFYKASHDAKPNFVNCYLQGMYAGETDPTTVPFSNKEQTMSTDNDSLHKIPR